MEVPLHTWYLASTFASQEAYEAFDKLLRPHLQAMWPSSSSRYWQPEIDSEVDNEDFTQNFDFTATAFGDQWTLQELSEVVKQSGTSLRSTNVNFVAVCLILRSNGRKADVLVIS
jgi:pre-rRNA-processing protein IPI1